MKWFICLIFSFLSFFCGFNFGFVGIYKVLLDIVWFIESGFV